MMLLCPNCGGKLTKDGNTYRCCNGHCFDIAKEGYVNLLIKHSTNPGDNNDSLASRNAFLNKGYYEGLALALRKTVSQYFTEGQSFLDAGCGTGYYLSYLTDSVNLDYYATDIAKKGVAMTAKKNRNATCFVGNVFHLPFENNSLDGLMSVFTPYSSQEFNRIIKKDGYVIAVTPGKMHLYDLKSIVYDNPYFNEESGYDLTGFVLDKQFNVTYDIDLDNNADINFLWKMMPYYYTTSKENNERLLTRDSARTKVDFLVSVYRKEKDWDETI